MADVGGAKFGERESPGRHDQRIGGEGAARGNHLEAVVFHDILHAVSAKDPNTRFTALALKHRNDAPGTLVAELLPEFLLVVGNPVFLDQ